MIIHAAANSSRGTSAATYAVALYAENEAALLQLERRLVLDEIPHCAYREPDRNLELMSIGINPLPRWLGRRYLKSFPLIGGEKP
jgi:hypothetical protein